MSDAKFKTYVVTDGENGDVFGNAKTISDLRRFMYESDKKDARIRDLEEENGKLKKLIPYVQSYEQLFQSVVRLHSEAIDEFNHIKELGIKDKE